MTLPRFYAILDDETAGRFGWTLDALARACIDGGARLLQLRVKRRSSREFLDTAERVVAAASPAGARVVVNDRADIARLAGAWGLHVGQDDLPVSAARSVAGASVAIGLSTHTPGQIQAASREAIDYIAVGPVFGTSTKDTGYAPVGLDRVRYAAGIAPGIPLVAIGGITLERAPSVIDAGAAAVAVAADLLAHGNPEQRVRTYVSTLGE